MARPGCPGSLFQQFPTQIIQIQFLLPFQITREKGKHPPVFGADGLGAGQACTIFFYFKNALPAAGHVAVFHAEGPDSTWLAGRNGEAGNIATFAMLYKVRLVQHFHH